MDPMIKEMAEKFKVDALALNGLVEFLKMNATKSQASREAFMADPESMITAGVLCYRERMVRMYSELADGTSEWAVEARKFIAESAYYAIKKEGGQ